MARNDEGEFELVLGNRQLLSGFFIVVVLFGVFFTMGYIVGRSSSPVAPAVAAAPVQEQTLPSRAPTPGGPPPGHAEVVSADPRQGETPPPERAATDTRPATAPPESPRPAETRAAQLAAQPRQTAGASDPVPGRYLQVAAPRRSAADGVVESLKNKGIVAVLAPGPNEDTVRVLVGPIDPANLGKVRVELESAGFKPFLKNY